jgi:hypothetical protein
MLTTALNRVEIERFSKHRWKWIGKEILEESAKELNLKPDMVRSIITEHEPGLLDDIVLSLSHKYYPGDVKIKRTFGSVIRTFAEEGHVVIVGRGGASITRDIPRSLHIKSARPHGVARWADQRKLQSEPGGGGEDHPGDRPQAAAHPRLFRRPQGGRGHFRHYPKL